MVNATLSTRVRLGLVGVLVVSVALGLAFRSRDDSVVDEIVYASIEDLAAAADAVVVGRVTGVSDRFIDRGGDSGTDETGEEIPGVPMIAFEVIVSESFAGDVPNALRIAMGDTEVSGVANRTPLKEGEQVMLFLRYRNQEQAPGIAEVANEVWVPLSGDRGVFDVVEGVAFPRSDDPIHVMGSMVDPSTGVSIRVVDELIASLPTPTEP